MKEEKTKCRANEQNESSLAFPNVADIQAKPKWGRHPKESRKTHCVMVRFDNDEWLKFLTMFEQSGVYAKAVFVKARVFGDTFRVLQTDKTLLDWQQLQPDGKGTQKPFFREKSNGFAL